MRRRLLAVFLLLPLGASGAAAQVESTAAGQSASGQSGTSQPSTRLREAAAALVRGNVDQAITLYTEVLEDKSLPNDRRATILNDRGVAYSRRQQHKEAIDDFNRAIQLYPEYAAVYNNRGNVLLGLGAVKEAIKDFDRALLLAPGYAAAYSNRAGAYMKLGQIERAIADYTKADRADAQQRRGAERARAARTWPPTGRTAPSATSRAPSVSMRASAPPIAAAPRPRWRSSATRRRSRTSAAPSPSSRATPRSTRCAGAAYLEADNAASGIKDFAKAIELEPELSAAFYAARGLAYAKAEAYDEALNDFAPRHRARAALAQGLCLSRLDLSAAAAGGAGLQGRRARPEARRQERRSLLGARRDQRGAGARRAGGAGPAQGAGARPAPEGCGPGPRAPGRQHARRARRRLPKPASTAGGCFQKGRQFVATNEEFPRLRINLEMMGKGQPRILEWDVKKPPFAGIAVLRFHAGVGRRAEGPGGGRARGHRRPAVEHAWCRWRCRSRASKLAQWTWDDGKLVVASPTASPTNSSCVRKPKEPPKRTPTIVGQGMGVGIPAQAQDPVRAALQVLGRPWNIQACGVVATRSIFIAHCMLRVKQSAVVLSL